MAANDLLVKLAKMFLKPKLQTGFLINNYDMTIAVLKVIADLSKVEKKSWRKCLSRK